MTCQDNTLKKQKELREGVGGGQYSDGGEIKWKCERRQKDRGRQEMDGFDTRSRSLSCVALSLSLSLFWGRLNRDLSASSEKRKTGGRVCGAGREREREREKRERTSKYAFSSVERKAGESQEASWETGSYTK